MKKDIPKLSLVICAYNEEKYISKCIEYAQKNIPQFYEIIVVDNASTDNTAQVIKTFANIKYIYEPQKWLTKARQTGFETAKWEIIAYIDADTQMPQWRHQKVIKNFENDNTLWFLTWPYIYYDAPWYSSIGNWIYWHITAYFMYLFTWYLGVWWNMIFRKDILQKMNWFDTRITFYSEDTNAARRAHEFAKCKFDLSLKMPTSYRRFNWQWAFNTIYKYVKAFFYEVILKKSYHTDYEDYR